MSELDEVDGGMDSGVGGWDPPLWQATSKSHKRSVTQQQTRIAKSVRQSYTGS